MSEVIWAAVIACVGVVLSVSIGGSLMLAARVVTKEDEEFRCVQVIGHDRCELPTEHEGPHLVCGQWWSPEQLGGASVHIRLLQEHLESAHQREIELRREIGEKNRERPAASSQEQRVREAFLKRQLLEQQNISDDLRNELLRKQALEAANAYKPSG